LEDIRSLDDIATPGSFWLNPPHARDDQGNKVDPIEVMLQYEEEATDKSNLRDEGSVSVQQSQESEDHSEAVEDMSDDELARILADMDSSS
jgi:hypothetical protein